jgi:putative methyltransferase (TIGR04325 family)
LRGYLLRNKQRLILILHYLLLSFKRKLVVTSWNDSDKNYWQEQTTAFKVLNDTIKLKDGLGSINITNYTGYFSALLMASGKLNKALSVVDYGGAFGADFIVFKNFFPNIVSTYKIVEQENYISVLKDSSEVLHLGAEFSTNLEDSINTGVDMIVARGVLPFLRDPITILNTLRESRVDFLFVDRVQVYKSSSRNFILCKTKVWNSNEHYFEWLFNEDYLLGVFKQEYKLVFSYEAMDGMEIISDGTKVNSMGYLFERI